MQTGWLLELLTLLSIQLSTTVGEGHVIIIRTLVQLLHIYRSEDEYKHDNIFCNIVRKTAVDG